MANGGGRDESDIRDGGDMCINEVNVNQGTVSEVSLANPVNQAEQGTTKDVMEKSMLDEVVGPSLVGLKASDGPINESGNNRSQGADKQRMWTKRARMDYGPVETLKESAKLILGKCMNTTQQQASCDNLEEQAGKRLKTEDVPQSTEVAGVSKHPCRAQ